MKDKRGWLLAKFDEVIQISRGISYSSANLTLEGLGRPMINLRNVDKGGGFRLDGLKYYDGEIKERHRVFPGDLLIANTDLSKAKDVLGSPILVPTGFGYEDAVFSLDLAKLSVNTDLAIIKYVMYFLESPSTRTFMKENGSGTTIMHLRLNALSNLQIPIPPIDRQREIVEKLDSAFAEIDLLETNLGKSDEKANQLLQSLLSAAFTSSVSTKEPSNSAANPGLAMKNMKLGEAVDLFNGSTPLKTNKDYWLNGDIPWFTVDDLRKQGKFITYTEKFITKLGLKESSISLIPENAVLLCCTASVGAIAINKIRLTTNQQFNALVVKDTKKLLVEYLYYWFLSNMDILKSLGRATTIDYVSMTKLRDMNFQLPSLEKQRDIVEKLDSSFDEIDLLKAQIKIKKDYATALRQSLLSSAFTQEEAVA